MSDVQEGRVELGPLLTVAEVATALRVSDMTIYRLIRAGELPAIRVGSHYRIREQALVSYLTEVAPVADQSIG
jgi:excisionase family DNA binding protein